MTTVIELNDLELTLYRGNERLYQAPGFAIVREDDLIFGEQAVRLARIHPQQANQQYISRMNADPLSQPVRRAANHADLVYLQLMELAAHNSADAVLAVPGTMTGDQLGILLGICQEAGIDVSGFVNSAVAALTTASLPASVLYLDVFLQHIQVSELSVDNEVRHLRSFEVRDCGFVNLLDGWVNLIADRFVQETRFDPLHTAASEQQLYNQVYDWVVGPDQHSEMAFQVVHNDQQRRVEVPRSQLENKASQRIDRLIDALPDNRTLALTDRAARIPGFAAHLQRAGFDLTLLNGDATANGCAEHMSLVRTADTELRLVNRLPYSHGVVSNAAADQPHPTHLLQNNIARALDAAGLAGTIELAEGGPRLKSGSTIQLNGNSVQTDTQLSLGDVLTQGADTFTLIRLEP